MMRRVLFTLSFVGLSFVCNNLAASESDSHDALIDAIVANADDCVTGYADEKIYLNAERIIPTEDGLFLNLNGQDYIPLLSLYSDQGGCYIAGFSEDNVKTTCPGCGLKYVFKCTNPNCSLKQKGGK